MRKNEGTPSKRGTKLIKQSPCLAALALVKTLTFTESELTEHHSRTRGPMDAKKQKFSLIVGS